jgi:UTP--glucose-1-phosphate uridylyltransferase
MNLHRAKSLIPVREGLSFLDLTARQILELRAQHRVEVPWLLMNSYHTRSDTLAALADYPLAVRGLPLDFLQNKVPRIERATGLPLSLPDEEANWAPPGHGDVYLALWQSGLLEQLIEAGIHYAFVSNMDNLSGTPDLHIFQWMVEQQLDFVMEVTKKMPSDIKGGPLVRYHDRLMLLERSQVDPCQLEAFEDTTIFPIFNTNNLWWHLDALLERLREGTLELPMIVNPKTVGQVEIVQLETAMGAGIGSFERAKGVVVPRFRFAPVKDTQDLLGVRSDAYILDGDWAIRPNPLRADASVPLVKLDGRYYKKLEDFAARIPVAPSMVQCQRLTVEGDLWFGKNIRLQGDVVLRNQEAEPKKIADDTLWPSGIHDA